ncbi:MAG: hypothetical protein [Vetruanivirus porcinprimi]|uniref:DUF1642 domain-containing protein n=1 Tax=phage Lak_Megaphage_RVC_AP1_GC26 TaxID=3109224 RepID=A0ABZ0Z4E5_9CAUD|nr:MAG: hypothetical protein [phage Lak_Megaphage_RVC_AP1_GC26]
MTEKEKAKAYDEAIERTKKLYSNGIAEEIFPELKESEDEKIRKEIISILRNAYWTSNKNRFNELVAWLENQRDKDKLIQELGKYKVKYTQEVLEKYINSTSNKDDERLRKTAIAFLKDFAEQGYENAVECIDWLEKQDKNSTNKNKTRFNVGDWVFFTTSKRVYQVEKKENYEYTLRDKNNGHSFCVSFSNEELIREWTIQDANDGDVIQLGKVTAIFKKYIGREKCICYCSFCKDGGFEIPIENGDDNAYGCYNATPATKEQRDAMIKAMYDAGYEWDILKRKN